MTVLYESDNLWKDRSPTPPPWAAIAWRNVPKTTNQSREEGLSTVNQPDVLFEKCPNGGETTCILKKTIYSAVNTGYAKHWRHAILAAA